MSHVGAQTWYSRRQAAYEASDDELSDVVSDAEPDEVLLEDRPRRASPGDHPQPAA